MPIQSNYHDITYYSQQTNSQMQANIEIYEQRNQGQNIEKLVFKGITFSPEEEISRSPEDTQRFAANRQRVTKKLNQFYLKTTERNITNKPLKSPVLLSENSSPGGKRTQRWSFCGSPEQQNEQIKGIQSFLAKEGLLQIFNCFQNFRNIMIESMSCSQNSQMVKTQIELYQAISTLKDEIRTLTDNKVQKSIRKQLYNEEESDNLEETSFLLQQISQLRNENQILRQKNNKLMLEVHKSQLTQYSNQNSLINNSISFGNSSLQSSQQSDEDCFNLDFQLDKIGNHHLPCTFGSKSTTVSLENSFLRGKNSGVREKEENILADQESFECSRVISEQNSYEVNSVKDKTREVKLCSCEKQRWIDLVTSSIKLMKGLLKNQFQACNYALSTSPQLKQLQTILKSYKQFAPSQHQSSEQAFLSQASEFFTFIQTHSQHLSVLLHKEKDKPNFKKQHKK